MYDYFEWIAIELFRFARDWDLSLEVRVSNSRWKLLEKILEYF